MQHVDVAKDPLVEEEEKEEQKGVDEEEDRIGRR